MPDLINESARLLSEAYPFPFRFTLLGALNKSPHHALLAHREGKDSRAYIFGRAFHQKLLTPSEEFLFWEKSVSYTTLEGKQFKKRIQEQGLEPFQLQKGELESIEAMVTALYRHKLTREMLMAESIVEQQMYWFDPDYKIPMRGKLDQYILDGGILADYKSTEDASFEGFLHSIRTYRYNVQAAMYTDALIEQGYEVNRSYLVAAEKKPPHGVGIFELPMRNRDVDKRYRDITIESGRAFYKRLAKIYRDCIENDTWESVYDESVFTF